jgi:beta-lactamase regulating signal transducer with metallopeptidase domain
MTPLAQAISAALLQFVWQGVLVTIVWQIVLFALRKHSPNLRYAASCVALAAMVALPVITGFTMYEPSDEHDFYSFGKAAFTITIRALRSGPVSAPSSWVSALQPWMLRVWIAGVLFLSFRLAWLGGRISSLRRASRPADAAIRAVAARLAARIGVRRAVRILVSALPDGPSVAGWIRPVIMMPAAVLLRLDEQQVEAILAHEIAHLQRYDDVVNIAQSLIETVLFYHPCVWWVSNRIRRERELCCDDLAVAISGDAVVYARALMNVDAMRVTTAGLVLGAAGDSLTYRIRRIAGVANQENTSLPGLVVLGIAVICCAVCSSPARGSFPAPRRQYPEVARVAGVQGTVPVEVKIDALGQVGNAKALGGPRELRQAAAGIASALQFAQVETTQRINVDFQLAQGQPNLAGRVVEDSSGAPLDSVELKVHKAGQRELVADLETDESGRFPAVVLPPGDYTADVSKPGFGPAAFPLHIPNTRLQVRLMRYAGIDGKVLNTSGRPTVASISKFFLFPGGRGGMGTDIGGTEIAILAKQPGSGGYRVLRSTQPDPDGNFRFENLPPGQYHVKLSYFGLSEGSGVQLYPTNAHPQVFTVSGGEEYHGVNFTVVPNSTASVSGTVELPGPGVFTASLALAESPGTVLGHAFAGEDGSFGFDQVSSGSYDLFVSGTSQGNRFFGRTRIAVGASDLKGVRVPLSPGRSLRIIVRAHHSEALPADCPQSATVSDAYLDPWNFGMGPMTTPVRFASEQALQNLAPGRHRLILTGIGKGCYAVNEPEVDISGNVPQPVVLEVAAAGSVSGDTGADPAGESDSVVVLVDSANGAAGLTRLAYPDARGHFAIDGLPPGRYRIAVEPAGVAAAGRWITDWAQMREIEVTGGQTTKVGALASIGERK